MAGHEPRRHLDQGRRGLIGELALDVGGVTCGRGLADCLRNLDEPVSST
jgi:hypothetical protein